MWHPIRLLHFNTETMRIKTYKCLDTVNLLSSLIQLILLVLSLWKKYVNMFFIKAILSMDPCGDNLQNIFSSINVIASMLSKRIEIICPVIGLLIEKITVNSLNLDYVLQQKKWLFVKEEICMLLQHQFLYKLIICTNKFQGISPCIN